MSIIHDFKSIRSRMLGEEKPKAAAESVSWRLPLIAGAGARSIGVKCDACNFDSWQPTVEIYNWCCANCSNVQEII